MVKNFLPLRPATGTANSLSSSDTASVRSDVSQWTTTSTIQVDSESPSPSDAVELSLYPLRTQQGLIVKIVPPMLPSKPIAHVPCDIVLVIDVSGSMGSNAPIPANPGEKSENYGLSVLDLVKHASKTILETLDEGDRLGIVTFASRINVLQKLMPMNEENKRLAQKNIDRMEPTDATNLWQGLLQGIKLFRESTELNTGRTPAIFILTDGQPNLLCPPQGYVPKMSAMEKLPASIHTFGFGYDLRSGLLKSIAEMGGGNYAFIPDAGMIGTVFVHAVANLQATFAINATLRLTYSTDLQIEETTGDSVDKQRVLRLSDRVRRPSQLTILLGNLQYGQTRDIYLRMKADGNMNPESVEIDASLQYSRMTSTIYNVKAIQSITKFTTLPESEIAYHISRSKICTFLSKIIPVRPDGEHQALISITPVYIEILNDLIANLPAQEFPNDMKNKSLLEDLSGPEPKGQISLALTNSVFYSKWGMHYLPSLLNAHTRQICNTFKDPGPLQYGVDSELFIACRDKLDNAFDNLPAPKPSNRGTSTYSHNFSMASYNTSAGVCFAASTLVHVASGSKVPICSLRKGVIVNTLSGPRLVFAVLKTPVAKEIMCRIGSLLVTPWHPISLDGGKNWKFPAETKSATVVRYTGCVYSILLQAGNTNDSHSLVLDNEICGVTLGHGLLSGPDVRAHPFFGDHAMVLKGLRRIGLERESGLAVGGGVGRDPQTGMVNGFRRGRRIHSIGKNGIRGFRSSRPILHKAVAQE